MSREKVVPRERGRIVKKWRGKVPVCVVFPNSYYIGMSNLAVHILYGRLNAMPDVVCERAFLSEEGKSLSCETGRSLSDFEVLFFTLSFEQDYLNIPGILETSSIAPLSRDRKGSDPLVVAGGMCVTANPEPLHGVMDLFLLGDIEAVIDDFMERLNEVRGRTRGDRIEGLGSFDFAYNPEDLRVTYNDDGSIRAFEPAGFEVKVKRFAGKTLGSSAIITDGTEFADMFLVEGTRGCPSRCPFCLLGNSYGFTQDTLEGLESPVADVGLIGGGISFHPRLPEILEELKGRGITPHLPSLRMDEVPLPVIESIKDNVKTLTFGLEAATPRLRASIGKPLTDEEIYGKIEAILAMKPFNLKLYFMIGLAGETMDDVDAIGTMTKKLHHILLKTGVKRGALGSITVHASPFVPKAATPFQWLPMDDQASLKAKVSRLTRILGKVDNTYFTHESVKFSFLQAILARGDRRVGGLVMKLASGANLLKALREDPVNPGYYALRERPEAETFPWDFIKGSITKEGLRRRLTTCLSHLQGK